MGRLALAVAAAIAVILSAPFAQQAFTEIGNRWPRSFRTIGIGATAVPAGAALVIAIARIRERRWVRYLAVGLGLGIGSAYILLSGLSFGESFHFVEYGVVAILFYRAWRVREDVSVVLLPVLAGTLAGTLDEWFQWFIPIRAGEARDVALNGIAIGCGLLVASGVEPPGRFTVALRHESLRRVSAWAAAAIIAFGLFFQSAHLGYDITDGAAGSFRSRYAADDLAAAGRERAERWRDRPPLVQRRVAREDQYLSEGLWHVQRRNQAWGAGDAFSAWRENLILETFFAPVLDTPSYAGASGLRWAPEQRADAAARAATDTRPYVSDANPLPMYAWPKSLFWTVHAALIAALAAGGLRSRIGPAEAGPYDRRSRL